MERSGKKWKEGFRIFSCVPGLKAWPLLRIRCSGSLPRWRSQISGYKIIVSAGSRNGQAGSLCSPMRASIEVTTIGIRLAREKLPANLRLCRFKRSLTLCGTRSENSEPMKKYLLCLLVTFVSMAFIAACQQEGTTVIEQPVNPPAQYMNRPAASPTH